MKYKLVFFHGIGLRNISVKGNNLNLLTFGFMINFQRDVKVQCNLHYCRPKIKRARIFSIQMAVCPCKCRLVSMGRLDIEKQIINSTFFSKKYVYLNK